MEKNEKNQNIYKKIYNIQNKLKSIKKDKVNPYYNSTYADINNYIEELKPLLMNEKLLLLQPLDEIDNILYLKTIIVDIETIERIEYKVALTKIEDAQKMGSLITYFRRYCLQSLFFMQAEDDDANSVVSNKKAQSNYNNQSMNNVVKNNNNPTKVKCKNFDVCGNYHDVKWDICWECKNKLNQNNPF